MRDASRRTDDADSGAVVAACARPPFPIGAKASDAATASRSVRSFANGTAMESSCVMQVEVDELFGSVARFEPERGATGVAAAGRSFAGAAAFEWVAPASSALLHPSVA